LPDQVFDGFAVKSCGAAPARYFSKFLRRAGLVGPVEDADLLVRQSGAAVDLGDGRVVPLSDLALEDLAISDGVRTSLSTPDRL
jgi:hypothetical protein